MDPFEDVFPIETIRISNCYVSLPEGRRLTVNGCIQCYVPETFLEGDRGVKKTQGVSYTKNQGIVGCTPTNVPLWEIAI